MYQPLKLDNWTRSGGIGHRLKKRTIWGQRSRSKWVP